MRCAWCDVEWSVATVFSIVQLPQEELKKMTKLQELYLEGNPLVYDRSNVRALAPTLSVVDEDNSLERLRPTTPTPTPMIATPLQPSLSYKKVEQEILQKEQTFQSLHDDIHSKCVDCHGRLYKCILYVRASTNTKVLSTPGAFRGI